ncbi:DUF1272 domain-containing protein [Caballeronia mineralivorans]|jgi:hypothetical protein|uniref:DUF1272 domain-containing protein n=1 Tax=Caballeronia mineralivorans TaxID=2010198 RepID=UPI0023F055B9|nr:DUF1272 domain-containing protein [Caballeronia mineralivorans]MDB5783331.1 hypothetical protein [Caballeronia mineralivorans]MEA3099567.1 uncharacterized protein [Caballeronia mineralivorans]
MLALRPTCECCRKALSPDARDAMICSFECTFCEACVLSRLGNVCPNCGGGFQFRPIRPKAMLERRPASTDVHPVGVDEQQHRAFFERYGAIPSSER